MQKLLVASTMILGIFVTGCHDSSKDKVVHDRMKDRGIVHDKIKDRGVVHDKMKDRGVGVVHDKMKDRGVGVVHDKMKDRGVVHEKIKERGRQELTAKQPGGVVKVNETIRVVDGKAVENVAVIKKEVPSTQGMTKARHRDIEIASKYSKCVKSGNHNCLLIREIGKEKWKVSGRKIDGFNYDQGYQYLVRVKETVDDKQKPRWKLVKVIHRKHDK